MKEQVPMGVGGGSSGDALRIGERVSIFGKAKEYRAVGVSQEDEALSSEEGYEFQSQKALEKWYSMKPELYALTSVMAERIVCHAYDEREDYPPYGLIINDSAQCEIEEDPTAIDSITSISQLEPLMRASLKRANLEVLHSFEHPPEGGWEDPAVSVYARLKSLIDFKTAYVDESYKILSSEKATLLFIQRGINEACSVMTQLLDIIPKVYKREKFALDFDDMRKTAKDSFPIVVQMANAHIVDFTGISDSLASGRPGPEGNKFKLECFDLAGSGAGLKIKPEVLNYDRDVLLSKVKPFEFTGSDTIGCPAMVNFDGRSAIKTLWDWHVELAGEIYENKYQEKNS